MTARKSLPDSRRSGFTLIEVLLALSIVIIVAIGTTSLMLDVGRGFIWASGKTQVTRDTRLFTMEMASEARACNRAYVYTSFAGRDRDQRSDRLQDGQTGDCLVLVNAEPYPDPDDADHITEMIIYFRRASDDNRSAVYKLKTDFAPDEYVDTSTTDFLLEDVMWALAEDDSGDHEVVLDLTEGLADGMLFKPSNLGRLVLVNAEILFDEKGQQTTNTYNLALSPRG